MPVLDTFVLVSRRDEHKVTQGVTGFGLLAGGFDPGDDMLLERRYRILGIRFGSSYQRNCSRNSNGRSTVSSS